MKLKKITVSLLAAGMLFTVCANSVYAQDNDFVHDEIEQRNSYAVVEVFNEYPPKKIGKYVLVRVEKIKGGGYRGYYD